MSDLIRNNIAPANPLIAFFLIFYLGPVHADDPQTDAANAANQAAASVLNAVASAMAAADSSNNTSQTAQQDANQDAAAAKADASASDAESAAASALDYANSALTHAMNAQNLMNRAANESDPLYAGLDQFTAAQEAAAAQQDAANAQQQAARAKTDADNAAQDAKDASGNYNNDLANDSVVQPTPQQTKKYQQQEQDDQDRKYFEDSLKQTAKGDGLKAAALEAEEQSYNSNVNVNSNLVLPGNTQTHIDIHISSFFDVIVTVDPQNTQHTLLLPNNQAPGFNPDIFLPGGDRFDLQVRLLNTNPFDVRLTGVRGNLFGSGVTFTPFQGTQTLAADSSSLVDIGSLAYTGLPGDFTSADFGFLTDATQPGLGPDVTVNFSLISEPPVFGLLLAACAAWLLASRKST